MVDCITLHTKAEVQILPVHCALGIAILKLARSTVELETTP